MAVWARPVMQRASELFLAQFHVPIGQVNEMLPAFVMVHSKIDLDEGTPFWALGFADEMHAGFLWRVVCLERIAGDAGANDVLPSRRTAAVARNDMI